MIGLDTLEPSFLAISGDLDSDIGFFVRRVLGDLLVRPLLMFLGESGHFFGEVHQGTSKMAKANVSKTNGPHTMLWSWWRFSQVRPVSRGPFGASSFTSRSGFYGKFRHPWPAKNFSLVFLARAGCEL